MHKPNRDEACLHCGRYANRGVSIDAVIVDNKKVLLIQRGVEPNKGYWGTPGGYVCWDESAEEAVVREVKEETNLDVIDTKLVGVYSSPSRHPKQVINLLYTVKVDNVSKLEVGDDASGAKWFSLDELPSKIALDHKQNIKDTITFLKANKV